MPTPSPVRAMELVLVLGLVLERLLADPLMLMLMLTSVLVRLLAETTPSRPRFGRHL